MRHSLRIIMLLAFIGLFGCTRGTTPSILTIPEAAFFPEGITADAGGNLYVGSIGKGTIVRIMKGEHVAVPFITDDTGLLSIIGITADATRDILWVCSMDLGIAGLTKTAPPSVRAYSLPSGKLMQVYPLEKGAFPNHIAIMHNGNALITDSFNPVIYQARLGEQTTTVWSTDPRFAALPSNPSTFVDTIGLNGITVVNDSMVYAVKTNTGNIYRIPVNPDGTAGTVSELTPQRRLERPDGLEALADGSLLIVEGGNRLTRLMPARDGAVIATVQDGLDFPTTTVTRGKQVWVVESQLEHMKSPMDAAPFRILRVDL